MSIRPELAPRCAPQSSTAPRRPRPARAVPRIYFRAGGQARSLRLHFWVRPRCEALSTLLAESIGADSCDW